MPQKPPAAPSKDPQGRRGGRAKCDESGSGGGNHILGPTKACARSSTKRQLASPNLSAAEIGCWTQGGRWRQISKALSARSLRRPPSLGHSSIIPVARPPSEIS